MTDQILSFRDSSLIKQKIPLGDVRKAYWDLAKLVIKTKEGTTFKVGFDDAEKIAPKFPMLPYHFAYLLEERVRKLEERLRSLEPKPEH